MMCAGPFGPVPKARGLQSWLNSSGDVELLVSVVDPRRPLNLIEFSLKDGSSDHILG